MDKSISHNSYFIDPESFIEKNEIINNKIINKNANKSLENIKYSNDDIIEIDTDSDSENTNNSYQSEFEKVIYKSEVTLQVLKEVPHHDDKENISSSTFNEFGKRPRGRPKECKPKKVNKRDRIDSPKPSTAPKKFNISLGFLSSKSKKSRDKSKKNLQNSIQTDEIAIIDNNDEINESTEIVKKRRGRPSHKSDLHVNKSITKTINETANLTLTNLNEDDISNDNNSLKINPTNSSIQINGNLQNSIVPIKKKRGRPFGTIKIKKDKKIKLPGQIGRPLLSNHIIEIAPKGHRSRSFSKNKQITNNRRKPGRPSLGLTKLKKYDKPGRPPLGIKREKKYDKPGRPRGPPKPIKIPGKRGPKPKPNTTQKKTKIPGRGRGRPSLASLVGLNSSGDSNIKNETEFETEQESDNSNNTTNVIITNDTESESENNLNIRNNDECKKNENNFDEIIIKNHDDIIETISLDSSDSNIDNENIIKVENTNLNNTPDKNGYFTVIHNLSKIDVHLEDMIHEKQVILQKHYI